MPAAPPADWYPDPFGRYERRYWGGSEWTEHVASGGRQAVDPPVVRPPSPTARTGQTGAGWYPDPSGRHERRYWDGNRWTDHVLSGGRQEIEPLPAGAAGPALKPPSKKVERQARRAGADGSQVGGGTLFTEPVLVVNQKAKLFGSTTGYAVYDQNGQQLGTVREGHRDLMTKASDRFRGRTDETRTYRLQVVDMNDRVLMAMTRPEKWFTSKSKMIVEGPDGTPMGQIAQETLGLMGGLATLAHAGLSDVSATAQVGLGGVAGLVAGTALSGVSQRVNSAVKGLDGVGHVRFGLEAGSQRLGSIHAESIEEWDFRVQDLSGTEIARITKTWAGWAKERFTNADNYVVQMHRQLEEPLRSLVIAAALALDLALKQGDPTTGSRTHRRYT